MGSPKPIVISDELAARCNGPDQAERFEKAIRHILSVPRAVMLDREAAYQRQAALSPNRRRPKPKNKVV